MKSSRLGILGLISLLSYTAMVVFSPLAYPRYDCFPLLADAPVTNPQNIMHIVVTALVVIFSLASLILIAVSAGKVQLKSLSVWAAVCLVAMLMGPVGTGLMPPSVFGLFERFSTFSAVVFNAVLGMYIFLGKYDNKK